MGVNLPLDLSRYYQSPFGQLGQTPSFVPGDDDDPSEAIPDELENYYPPVVSSSATASAGPRQKSPAEQRANQDYDQLRAAIATAPKQVAPKWWQSLAAGAAGFGAGWSNAASRTKNPINIAEMQDDILHPGYRQKLQEWQSRVAPLQQVAGLDQSQAEMERRNRQLDLQEDWNQARIGAEKQRGDMYGAHAWWYRLGKNPAKGATAPTTADLLNNIAEIEKNLGRKLDPDAVNYYLMNKGNMSGYGGTLSKDPHWTVDDYYMGIVPGETPEQKKRAGEAYSAKHPGPDLEGRDLSHQLKEFQLGEAQNKVFDNVQKTKDAEEARLHAQRHQEVATLLSKSGAASEDDLWKLPETATQLRAINQRYASKLQSNQDHYAASIRARGGKADDWKIDPNTLRAIPK